MRCRPVLTRIDAMRTGELPASEQEVVHEHLSTCSSCNDSVFDDALLVKSVKALAVVPPRSWKDTIADAYEQLREGNEVVWVAFSDNGLRLILRGGSFDDLRSEYAKRYCRGLKAGTMPDALRKQVLAALAG